MTNYHSILLRGLDRLGEEVINSYGRKAKIIGVLVWEGVPVFQTEEPCIYGFGDIDMMPIEDKIGSA